MESTAAHRTLKVGEMLNWYRIDGVLGRGGFGVIYRATDTNLDHVVAIKEYIPAGCARRDGDTAVRPLTREHGELYRWGLERFIKEARNLVRFKHPNIVRVMSVFQQNNTAYMVMEFESGVDLGHFLDRGGATDEATLKTLIGPVCEGLAEVHRHGFIHRDIKPANIMVRADGTPVVLDFGSARDATLGGGNGLTALVTVGYAPLEQYDDGSDEQQGPWTDIYALGGVLYHAISGRDPVDSARRGSALLNGGRDPLIPAATVGRGRYGASFLAAIDWALEFRIADRPQTLSDWQPALLGRSTVGKRPPRAPALDAIDDLGLDIGEGAARSRTRERTGDRDATRVHPPAARVTNDARRTAAGPPAAGVARPRGAFSALPSMRLPATLGRRRALWRRYPRRSIALAALAAVAVLLWSIGREPLTEPVPEATSVEDATPSPDVTESDAAAVADGAALDVQRAEQAARLAALERREAAFAEREAAAREATVAAEAERLAALEAERAEAERLAAEEAARLEAAERRAEAARAERLAAASRSFTAALDEAEAALAERRTDDAAAALERARATGFEGRRLAVVAERLERVVAEMRRPVDDAEFDRVVRRFDGLKRAIESKDLAVIDALTVPSDQNGLFEQLMDSFDRLNMEITGIRVRNADKSVSANLRIRDMIRPNGDRAMPSAAFRDREITSRLVDGEWSPITW